MRVYLDNNATTKMDKEVLDAMMPYLTEFYGNSSSVHLFGKETNKALMESRAKIANYLGITPDELIFTASGSEADNLAIRGIARAYKNRGKHIITSPIEHPAVKNTLKDLEEDGYEITTLPVDENGLLHIEDVKNAIREDTILITVMHANNEVGTFQPIEEIGKLAKEHRIIFHVDAVQTMGKLDIKPKEMGIDLLSFSGHKFYGPKGIGGLFWRTGVRFGKVLTGGGQEKKRRPGTSNIPAIVGMAKALEIAYRDMDAEWKKEEELRDYFETQILDRVPEIVVNARGVRRLPGTSSVTFKYLEGESILLSLSYKGIAVSSGSACSSDDLQASHVLLAMGIKPEFAHGTIRFGIGKYNTKEEIDYVLDSVVEVVNKLRAISPLWNAYQEGK
ncbi:Cysteine desulfurase IscS [Fusobacterium sp. DD29]|uniref:cysteine desulfurase family protein n=1 Tax=unclassified Fusobacterium TaxID=2648384 RepID=UPI001B8DA887|nr:MULTISPECIES: cysteine desulfurase family protein [unclassified Fusobacterium]MBR8701936.1 Cysteine desulfurase IscS [Fusobacterium sp. DD45]MBR8711737.1 Cysteine desulfurase IscS [Fusobacterium sp. DD28]MBR8749460.1 Cysteine desulfurase IscS [Fusobacterium sp. DD29]MBR8752299.1 Cysteine desulfurase IscS [Fusobacterium sp. DD26]MBR8761699.1 Cysteine desulfurase IscS [Fusobacterium sp. DD25]